MQYDLTHPSIPSQKHIGLINVNTRIKTIWGENYGIKVHSDSSGTSVTLCTPKLSYDSISGDLD